MSGDKSKTQSGNSTRHKIVAKLSDRYDTTIVTSRVKSQTKAKQDTDATMKDLTKDSDKTPKKRPKVIVT